MNSTIAIDHQFIDTNFLVYVHDPGDPTKQAAAQELLDSMLVAGKPIVSVQVLSEFFRTVSRPRRMLMTAEEAEERVRALLERCRVVANTPEVLLHALTVRRLRKISFWDALVHAAAKLAGTKLVLSEDLVHLDTFEGVRYLNPFASLSPSPPASPPSVQG